MRLSGQKSTRRTASAHDGEQGYMLLGLVVAIFLILLSLSVAASDMAKTIRREKERESERRAKQYVRAIRLFYLKNGRYPPSLDALKNTNMVRYLRQEYKDPLTGKDYRLIAVGQNKTTPSGFFGQPLGGIAGAGLGSAAGMQSTGMGGAPGATGTPGGTGASGLGSAFGALGTPAGGAAGGVPGAPGGASTGPGGATSGLPGTASSTTPFGNALGTGGSIGPFMGVGTQATGNSILIVNGQSTYDMWEFLYDPREEKLRATAALNAGMTSGSLGSLGAGQTPGSNSGFGSSGNTPLSSGFGTSPAGTPGQSAPPGTAAPGAGNSPFGP